MGTKRPLALYGGKIKELNADDEIVNNFKLYEAVLYWNASAWVLNECSNTTGATVTYDYGVTTSGYHCLTFSANVLTGGGKTHVQVSGEGNDNGDGTVSLTSGYLRDGLNKIKVLTLGAGDVFSSGAGGAISQLGFSITIKIFPTEE